MKLNKEQGILIWMTGLSGSGKSTIASELKPMLEDKSYGPIVHLDGDIVRESLCSDLKFSKEDRDENLRRISAVASILVKNKINVICTFISPFREKRREIRDMVDNFIEVFVDCDISECERRDVKGMYKLAREGKIKEFTGIDSPFECPSHPEVLVKTKDETVEQSAQKILNFIEEISNGV